MGETFALESVNGPAIGGFENYHDTVVQRKSPDLQGREKLRWV